MTVVSVLIGAAVEVCVGSIYIRVYMQNSQKTLLNIY